MQTETEKQMKMKDNLLQLIQDRHHLLFDVVPP